MASPGGREIKAARNIVSRRIDGIPKRGYIMGDCDSAPVIQGVADMTTAAYALLDAMESLPYTEELPAAATVTLRMMELKAMMEEHRCPPATAEGGDA